MARNLQMGSKTLLKTKLPSGWRKQTCNCDLEDLINIGGKPGRAHFAAHRICWGALLSARRHRERPRGLMARDSPACCHGMRRVPAKILLRVGLERRQQAVGHGRAGWVLRYSMGLLENLALAARTGKVSLKSCCAALLKAKGDLVLKKMINRL